MRPPPSVTRSPCYADIARRGHSTATGVLPAGYHLGGHSLELEETRPLIPGRAPGNEAWTPTRAVVLPQPRPRRIPRGLWRCAHLRRVRRRREDPLEETRPGRLQQLAQLFQGAPLRQPAAHSDHVARHPRHSPATRAWAWHCTPCRTRVPRRSGPRAWFPRTASPPARVRQEGRHSLCPLRRRPAAGPLRLHVEPCLC